MGACTQGANGTTYFARAVTYACKMLIKLTTGKAQAYCYQKFRSCKRTFKLYFKF